MRTGLSFAVTTGGRLRLEAIVGDRNAKQKHVKRAKVILATADGCGTVIGAGFPALDRFWFRIVWGYQNLIWRARTVSATTTAATKKTAPPRR